MADAMPDVCVVCVLWGGGDAGQASPQLPPLGLPATTPEPPAQLRLLPPGVNTVPPPPNQIPPETLIPSWTF